MRSFNIPKSLIKLLNFNILHYISAVDYYEYENHVYYICIKRKKIKWQNRDVLEKIFQTHFIFGITQLCHNIHFQNMQPNIFCTFIGFIILNTF